MPNGWHCTERAYARPANKTDRRSLLLLLPCVCMSDRHCLPIRQRKREAQKNHSFYMKQSLVPPYLCVPSLHIHSLISVMLHSGCSPRHSPLFPFFFHLLSFPRPQQHAIDDRGRHIYRLAPNPEKSRVLQLVPAFTIESLQRRERPTCAQLRCGNL